MSRIKTIRGEKRLNGSSPRTRTNGKACPKDAADMSAISGGQYLNYYMSAQAFEVAEKWTDGAEIEWEVDDQDQPTVVHLSPATARGFTLRQRPHFVLPTGDVGIPDVAIGVLKPAEEVAIDAEMISVKLPFAFTITIAETVAQVEEA